MITYLTITVLFNTLLFLAFLLWHRNLHPLEGLVYWLFTAAVISIFKEIIFLNEKWIETDSGPVLLWILEINQVVMMPGLTVWLFDFYLSKTTYVAGKILLTAGWFLILTGFQYLNMKAGVLRFSDWNVTHSILEWLFLYLLVAGAAVSFRKLLKKEAFLT